ncbi:magnesium transporter CorA family protein [Cognatilysobacter lacus]|nr:CorA family divalent cation transporter [Lysobacter lacus]
MATEEDTSCADPAASRLRVLLFEDDQVCREIDPDSLFAHASVPDHRLLWVNANVADGLPQELAALGANVQRLDPDAGGTFGLVIEGDWTYLHLRALNWHDEKQPTQTFVAMGIGPNVVATVHRGHIDFIAGVLGNEADQMRIGMLEATSFAMGLLDRMLTDYLDARDAFESSLDRIELLILRRARPGYLAELQSLRHKASKLRRHLAAQRDLFDALGRPDFDPRLSDSAQRHCRAVSLRYGHVVSVIESARELVNGSFDLYTSRSSESTNQAMHTLTVVTVAMGLAATIAGVLGMNFQAHLFDAGERGFEIASGLIALLVVGSGAWALWRLKMWGR